MLFEKFRHKPTENQLVAKQVIERRTKETLIEKFKKDFHTIDMDDKAVMYEYMIWNIKDIFWAFTISADLREGLTIPSFTNAIYDVIMQNPEYTFSEEEIIGFNDAAYMFLATKDSIKRLSKSEKIDIKDKIIAIAKHINPNGYDDLKIFENSFDVDFLNEIFITRNSSKKEPINIRRVNFIVFQNLSPWVYEDLDLLGLYRNLFWNNIEELFLVSMLDVYDEATESWYTHTMAEMDGWITNAIIYLLNELPISSIRKTITEYSQICLKKQLRPTDVRCSLRALSMDYNKVRFVAEELYEDGLYIL